MKTTNGSKKKATMLFFADVFAFGGYIVKGIVVGSSAAVSEISNQIKNKK